MLKSKDCNYEVMVLCGGELMGHILELLCTTINPILKEMIYCPSSLPLYDYHRKVTQVVFF